MVVADFWQNARDVQSVQSAPEAVAASAAGCTNPMTRACTHALPFPPFSANKAISCIKASDKKMSLSRCQQKKNSRVLGGFGQRMYFCEYCVRADGYLHLRSTSYRFSIKAAGGARGRVVRVRGYDGAATRHAFAPVAVAMEL